MSKSKVMLAFLSGAAAGAVLGLLFTTEKGSEIRKKVAHKAKDLADSILEKAEEIIKEVEDTGSTERSEKAR